MKKTIVLALFVSVLMGCASAADRFSSQPASANKNCEVINPSLQAMPLVDVVLRRDDGTQFALKARLANTNSTRAAGFQRVCESTIKETPILFVFDREVVPSFHMHNVVAPIDIAFITSKGRVDSIYTMQPYSIVALSKPLYSPKSPVIAALEAHKDFYKEHNISLSSEIVWGDSVELGATTNQEQTLPAVDQ